MNAYLEHGELMVTLPDGTSTYAAVVDQVLALLDAGHAIEVHDDGEIVVTPPVHPDVIHSIGPVWPAVRMLAAMWRASREGNNAEADE
jgi:hypothetical protein